MTHLELPWSPDAQASTIAERVAAVVARRIAEGDLAPGDLLTEVDVAQRFDVSRTPVREAMLALERWGLVRLAPKKGATVTNPSETERTELLAVRSMLERHAVDALAAASDQRASLIESLDEALAAQRGALNDPRAFAVHDYAFHLRVIRCGGNAVIAQIARDLGPRLYRLTRLAVNARAAELEALLDEHAALADAIRAGDPDRFRSLIEEHLAAGHAGYELDR